MDPDLKKAIALGEFEDRVERLAKRMKWRYGQALFNALAYDRPEIAEALRGTVIDPFHITTEDSPTISKAWQFIKERW